MANAREMLDSLPNGKEEVEKDPFPTIRESLAELGTNPDKYEKILAQAGEKLHWEKVFRPKTTLEVGAITLLAAAKQSGAEPNEYLSRLAPYFDSRIQSLPDLYNASGYVSGDAPTRAVLTRTARDIKGSASTLPHELEHTLQNKDFDLRYQRGKEAVAASGEQFGIDSYMDKVKVPGRPEPVSRFGLGDTYKMDLLKRLSELPEEERVLIASQHPVFGDYLSSGNELFARIRAKDMLDSAKGQDFLQTDLGQKLFPTDRDRSYFIGSTLPGVPKISPPYTFESTEQKKKPLTDPNTSYARQMLNRMSPKKYEEGGSVSKDSWDNYIADDMPKESFSDLSKNQEYLPLNVQRLLDAGAIRVTDPSGNPSEEGFSLVSRWNDVFPESETPKWANRPDAYSSAINALNKPGPLYDGKYRQILWSAKQLGLSPEDVFLDKPKKYQEGGEVTDEFPEEAGAMPGQSPSEAAKQMLYYKKKAAPPLSPKLPPGIVPDTGQLDGIYQEPTVASETARVFGMKPRDDRSIILPYYSRATGWVAPEMLYDAARAITAPSVAARGYEVAPEDAVNTALNFMGAGVGTSTTMKKPTGGGAGKDLAMFVGQKSDTWDMDKYTTALDLEKAGIDPAEINRLTGYWKNPSSKIWSQEISDHTASLIPGGIPKTLADSVPITDVLNHAPLFKAYPELKNVTVKRESGVGAEGAKFDPRINTLFIGDKITDPKTQLSYMVHELQHWVQTKENFPRGTSPEEIAKIETPEMAKINERLGQLYWAENRQDPKNIKEFTELMAKLKNLKRIQKDNSFDLYSRVEGEAQARATQSRMWMDEQNRRSLTPLGDFDVPVTELVQMGDFGKLAPTSRVPGAPASIAPPMKMTLPSGTTAKDDLAKVPKAPKVLAPANESGFYSPTEAAALNLQRKSGSGQAFLNDLLKQENVRPDEINAMGLDTFLKDKKNVTTAEVQDYIANNKIQLGEARYGKKPSVYDFAIKQGMTEDDAAGVAIKAEQGDPKAVAVMDAYRNLQDPKFSGYQLPGGENYREVVITLPAAVDTSGYKITGSGNSWFLRDADNNVLEAFGSKDQAESTMQRRAASKQPDAYRSSHWNEINPLAHLRMSDRVTDGKKTLLVDEVQSDWHQAGREQGYKDPQAKEKIEQIKTIKDEMDSLNTRRYELYAQAKETTDDNLPQFIKLTEESNGITNKMLELNKQLIDLEHFKRNQEGAIPDAPFKDDWYQLALKRAVKEAIDGGYDRVALPTGARVAERFDLSKQISEVHYSGSNLKAYDLDGNEVISQTGVKPEDLPSYIGKETANKLLEQPKQGTLRSLVGQDLKVGGEGMKKYYDEIYPGYLKKFGKKYGAGVGKTTTPTEYARDAQGIPSMYPTQEPLFYMDITPKMREEFSTGIPMKDGGEVLKGGIGSIPTK